MIVEAVTLADMRIAIKSSSDMDYERMYSCDSGQPLVQPIQDMASDIGKWFNPDHGWKLVAAHTALIQATATEPHRFNLGFYFDGQDPPRSVETIDMLHFSDVFTRFQQVNIARGIAEVHPEKVGSVYPLGRALKEFSSPYYLVSATVGLERNPKDEPRLVAELKMEDLSDYVRLEVNRLRRVQRQLRKRFPLT